MDNAQILSWVVGAVGISGFLLAGRKVWWSWYVNIACQLFWVLYAIASDTPAFFYTAFFYTGVFAVNAYKWTREHRTNRRYLRLMNENKSGTFTMPSGVVVNYENLGK
jgi:hypothetical protein